ncbi:MAG: cation transporting ATPase C-terminal domain-containing protein, partial [Deltaproteobacteria bacterium]|nr:cation transporting ATPase C-terminal domain-containing protein [Deltaproteobacteria bacterium]
GQAGNVFACRTERDSIVRAGFFTNRLVLLGIAVELGILLSLVYLPSIRRFFGFAALGAKDWALLASFPVILLLAAEAGKYVLRLRA